MRLKLPYVCVVLRCIQLATAMYILYGFLVRVGAHSTKHGVQLVHNPIYPPLSQNSTALGFFSPLSVVAGRCLVGVSMCLRTVVSAELCRCYTEDESLRVFSWMGMAYVSGTLATSVLSAIFTNVSFNIVGILKIEKYNARETKECRKGQHWLGLEKLLTRSF